MAWHCIASQNSHGHSLAQHRTTGGSVAYLCPAEYKIASAMLASAQAIDQLLEARDPSMSSNLPPYTNLTALFNVRKVLAEMEVRQGLDGKEATCVVDCDSSMNFSQSSQEVIPCLIKSRPD
eukprot:11081124-Karenia_brevis.AAC.1